MKHLSLIGLIALAAACTAAKPSDAAKPSGTAPVVVATDLTKVKITPPTSSENPVAALPRAVVYKTNVNVDDHVAVSLSGDGKSLLTYPAVTDVGSYSTPIHLSGGWLLDRRGTIGYNTAFLKYTYDDYAALKQTPSVADLLKAVIPGARVINVRHLDISMSEALADTAAVNRLLSQP